MGTGCSTKKAVVDANDVTRRSDAHTQKSEEFKTLGQSSVTLSRLRSLTSDVGVSVIRESIIAKYDFLKMLGHGNYGIVRIAA
jgi:hypothetical protein